MRATTLVVCATRLQVSVVANPGTGQLNNRELRRDTPLSAAPGGASQRPTEMIQRAAASANHRSAAAAVGRDTSAFRMTNSDLVRPAYPDVHTCVPDSSAVVLCGRVRGSRASPVSAGMSHHARLRLFNFQTIAIVSWNTSGWSREPGAMTSNDGRASRRDRASRAASTTARASRLETSVSKREARASGDTVCSPAPTRTRGAHVPCANAGGRRATFEISIGTRARGADISSVSVAQRR